MIFSEKLALLRKNKGLTQDALAERLNVSRQAVAKWESGQSYPDISNLIQISDMMNVTVDYLVRDGECMMGISPEAEDSQDPDLEELIRFRLEANMNTYAAFMNEVPSTRLDSHDFRYENGNYTYHDSYVHGIKEPRDSRGIDSTGMVFRGMQNFLPAFADFSRASPYDFTHVALTLPLGGAGGEVLGLLQLLNLKRSE